MFKSQFQISFTNLHSDCKWDFAMVRVIYHIWEICQMHGCCQWPNGKYGHYTQKRNHYTVQDFRVSGNI